VERRKSQAVQEAIIDLLKPCEAHEFTLIADNGKEFADHQVVSSEVLNADFFFAHPCAAWEQRNYLWHLRVEFKSSKMLYMVKFLLKELREPVKFNPNDIGEYSLSIAIID
jgi:hypothetical protein